MSADPVDRSDHLATSTAPLTAPSTLRDRFRSRLAERPILADGAMGTLLYSRGIPQRACLDELATTRPELVGAIHREYLEAGADLIETATFGANRVRLAPFGLAAQAHRLNRRAAQVAREARDVAARDALVAGSIGPLGAPRHAPGGRDEGAIRGAFREQVDGLLEGGVDLFIVETFSELDDLLLAIDEVRAAADLPVVASLTFGEEVALLDGSRPGAAAAALEAIGVDAIGVNCGAGPVACLEALEAMGPGGSRIGRSIMPNAGLPQRIDERFVYAAGPAYFAAMVPNLLAAGAGIVGGCCGTTPEHVAAMRRALDASAAIEAPIPAPAVPGAAAGPAATPEIVSTGAGTMSSSDATAAGAANAPPPTGLARRLAAGHFVISVEIDPPRSVRIDRTLEAARLLQSAGVDLVNVSDSAMARVRMGCMAVAFGIQHDLDLECLVHFTTRDRNLMAIESELLGAHALGVRDILALTGDPPRIGDYPTGTGVWDVDSVGLIGILARLNRGEDGAGSPIGQPAGFTVACALDPTAADQPAEWDRLAQKLGAGAHLVMTQPLYSLDQVQAMLDQARRRFGPAGFPVPVLLGVLPLQSGRHTEFLHNEVPGITIPDPVRAAMAEAGDRAAEVGLELALDLLTAVAPLVAGTYIMASFGRYEQAAELVRRVRAALPATAAGARAR
jgi:methionine synthase / methylenetetrahydrofolate reductase(NADPH)